MDITNLKNKAINDNVPIMQDEGLEFLLDFIRKNNIKTILEIGTAVGYSAIKMDCINKDIKIVSIERDEARYKQAVENVKSMNLENRIELIFDDAFNVELQEKFDLIANFS